MPSFLAAKQVVDRNALPYDESSDPGIDFSKLLRAARRQFWIVLLFCIVGIACGAMYLVRAVPRYTATTVVVIDSAKDKSGLAASIADLTYDSGAIDSQLEVLKSENVARAVVNNLKLDSNPKLDNDVSMMAAPLAFFRRLLEKPLPALTPEEDKAVQDRMLISKLQSNLDVRRVGRSYVINVDYTSPDPIEAARISNAFAQAYIGEQLESRFDSTRRASSWLEQKITEVKQKTIESDLAIQKFKASQDIRTADNKLISDQQLAELSSQLVIAKSELARAEARHTQIRDLMKSNNLPAVVSDTLGSPVINELRKKYLEAAATEAELSNTLGPEHLQAQKLRRTMYELSMLILSEVSRIAAAYKSDAEVARAREASLERSLAALAARNVETNEAAARLREMQRESDSYKALYASFVQRLQQVQELQSLPGSEAHIITPASPPARPSSPKRLLAMALSLFFGGLVGIAVGALRESYDNVFRIASDVRDGLGMEFLGMLPAIQPNADSAPGGLKSLRAMTTIFSLGHGREREALYAAEGVKVSNQEAEKRAYPPPQEEGSGNRSLAPIGSEPAEIDISDPTLNYVLDRPFSSFVETLIGTKLVIDNRLGKRPLKVVGFISMSANEGKSTISKNFASLVASLGEKVLLIDGDMHRSGLTKKLAKQANIGIVEVIRGECTLDQAVLHEQASGLCFLPGVVAHRRVHPSQLLTSSGMRNLLEQASARFEYVIIDLPPIGPSVDVRASSALFDCFVLLVKWGHTLRHLVQTSMVTEREISDRCVGVLYNDVQLDRIQLYEGPGERHYHYQEYAKPPESVVAS